MPTEISNEKIKAYEATHYRAGAGPGAVHLRIKRHSPELMRHYRASSTNCALFITAFNPLGMAVDDQTNEAAHTRLGSTLRSLVNSVVEGEGVDPTGEWPPEKSYLALGIDEATARALGRRFKQDAVVWAGGDAIPQLLLLR